MKFVRNLFNLKFLFCLISLFNLSLLSYNLPYVDLGLSNFLCGVPFREDNGWYYIQIAQMYNASKYFDGQGNLLSKNLPTYNSWAGISTLTYQTNARVLNARPGFTIGIPYLFTSKITPNEFFASSGKGFGDIFVQSYLQWDEVLHKGRPVFQKNLGFVLSFPSGKAQLCSDEIATINPGNSLYQFSPFWGYTFYLRPELTFSGYAYYIFTSQNKITKIYPGQAIDLVYNLLYQFSKSFYFGFNGYFLQQLQNDKIGKEKIVIPNTKERVMGSGFGALYAHKEITYFAFHLYFESLARSKSQGINFILRIVQLF